MARAIVWGTGAIAILVAAMFVPVDFSYEEGSGPDETAQRPSALERSASPPRSISAALSESDTHPPQTNAASPPAIKNSSPRSRTTDPADRAPRSPATMSLDGTAPLFTGQRVLANTTPAATVPAIRAIQSELRRHGCYDGVVDGDWGPASRYAAASFTKAVNAALPVDQPDVALLALARRHPGRACDVEDTGTITSAATTGAIATGSAIVGARNSNSVNRQPTARAPRIVRSGGAPAIATVLPTSPLGTLPNRMALGIELPPGGAEAAAPVTRKPSIARDPAASARRNARNRNRVIRRRASNNRRWRKRRRWRQQVFKPIDLAGQ